MRVTIKMHTVIERTVALGPSEIAGGTYFLLSTHSHFSTPISFFFVRPSFTRGTRNVVDDKHIIQTTRGARLPCTIAIAELRIPAKDAAGCYVQIW